MKKTTIPIILGIFLISFTSALSLYSGESYTWDFGDNIFVNYSISGNTYDLEGLNFTNTTNTLTLDIAPNYKPDSWTITINTLKKVITEEVKPSRRRGICSTEWTCSEWGSCVDSQQTRICSYPAGWCKPVSEKPEEIRSCVVGEPTEPGDELPTDDIPEDKPKLSIILLILLILGIILLTMGIRMLIKMREEAKISKADAKR